jgi:tetratricopeptide (TPR) repeat protein
LRRWGKAGEYYEIGEEHFLAGRYRESLNFFLKAVKLRPDVAEIHKRVADSYYALGNHEKAVESYKKAMVQPDSADTESLDSVSVAEALYSLGRSYSSKYHTNDAIDSFKKSLKINPNSTQTNFALGSLLRRCSKPREAIKYLQKAVNLSFGFHEAHYELGMCHIALGNGSAAKDEYEYLVENNSEFAQDLWKEISGENKRVAPPSIKPEVGVSGQER